MIRVEQGTIVVPITPAMVALAQHKSTEMGVLRKSIRNGAGNVVGFLGELVVLAAWRGAVSHNTFQHDITHLGASFEVKTKQRSVAPQAHFDASVADYNRNQRADFYVFVSVHYDQASSRFREGSIVGIIEPEQFHALAVAARKDAEDAGSENRFRYRAPCHNIKHQLLANFVAWQTSDFAP